jgi:hypothetical protein
MKAQTCNVIHCTAQPRSVGGSAYLPRLEVETSPSPLFVVFERGYDNTIVTSKFAQRAIVPVLHPIFNEFAQ